MRRPSVRSAAAVIALAAIGCGRVGYDALDAASGVDDAGTDDARPASDASALDASTDDASTADASAADAGVPDSRVPDAGPPCPADAIFCDGYEDPALAAWSYSVVVAARAQRTTDRARTGEASLVCSGPAGVTREARYAANVLGGLRTGDVWVRAWYYLPSTVDLNVLVSLISVTEREIPYEGAHLVIDPDSVDIEDSIADYRHAGAVAMPRNRWVCLEMHTLLDDTAGALEAYVDGARIGSATGIDTVPANGLEVVEIGIHYATPEQSAVELYVDDVAIAPTRVGCP